MPPPHPRGERVRGTHFWGGQVWDEFVQHFLPKKGPKMAKTTQGLGGNPWGGRRSGRPPLYPHRKKKSLLGRHCVRTGSRFMLNLHTPYKFISVSVELDRNASASANAPWTPKRFPARKCCQQTWHKKNVTRHNLNICSKNTCKTTCTKNELGCMG